jgi:hypothetical protein
MAPATTIAPEAVPEHEDTSEHEPAGVQPNEDELTVKREETAKDITTLQPQDSKQETPSPATRDQPTPAVAPETKPTTVASWTLREVMNSTAVLQGPAGTLRVMRGDTVPGLGKVTSIVRWGNGWVVSATAGYCTSSPVDHADGICKPYRD